MGYVFEKICKQALIEPTKQNKLNYTKIGKWWHKDCEIDLAAIDEDRKKILFAECKWQENVDANQVLADLKKKATFVKWSNKDRKENYMLFAKSFKEKRKAEYNTLLFDLESIKELTNKNTNTQNQTQHKNK